MTHATPYASAHQPNGEVQFGRVYLGYVVFAFFLANLLSNTDRVVVSVIIVPLRHEFALSDSEVGALGFAFAIFYALFGLVLGRLADTRSRSRLLSVSFAIACLASALAGFAQSFAQLFACRVAAGVGEAGSVPTKYSLIGDTFRPEHRASALALIQAGLGVGTMVGLVLGGVLADRIGWRATVMLFGAPGILLALLMAFTLREPGRGVYEMAAPTETPALGATLRALSQNTTFTRLVIAYAFMTFALFGSGNWLPSFLVRSHHMSLTDVGLLYGGVTGTAMVAGIIASAVLTPRILARERRWELWAPAVVNCAVALCQLGMFAAPERVQVFAFAAAGNFLLGLSIGPASAAIQSTVSAHMRGVAVAVTMFTSSLIGSGLGPWAIGALSDALAQSYGENSLRAALLFSPIALLVSGIIYFAAGLSFHRNRVD